MIEEINKYWFNRGHFNEDQREYFIMLLTERKPRYCLEIGFASGRSCVTTLIAAEPIKMISIDINLDYCGAREHSNTILKRFNNLSIVEGDSNAILTDEFIKREFPNGIEFIFVDGAHDYTPAKKDIENAYKVLNKGGLLVVDDYNAGEPNGWHCEAVNRAVNTFSSENNASFYTWNKNGKGLAIFNK